LLPSSMNRKEQLQMLLSLPELQVACSHEIAAQFNE
jgi:hypothetical protein